MTRDDYFKYGSWAAIGSAAITFLACWIYCVSEYGFLVGVSLGWIPSAICAAIAGGIFYYAWGLIAAGAAISAVYYFSTAEPATKASEEYSVASDAAATATDAAATAADAASVAAEAAAAAAAMPPTAADAAADAAAIADRPSPQIPAARGPYVAAFGSTGCTQDCGGHNAGYQWAEDNGITDPGDCDGNSDSFIEGCEAYAEEN